ncbi:MAG: serine/threonine protein kinase [Phycisphaerae bacterium]|nr:serine/threonine protein kinase [Phycisphaerae bacterium]
MERERVHELARRVLHEPKGRREEFLRAESGGDEVLRRAVEAHLRELESVTLAPSVGTGTPIGREPSPAIGDGWRGGADESSGEPRSFGNYRLLSLLGEGGMGVVYLAEQARTRRRVALKLVRAGLASPRVLRRFELEVQALGRLEHPNIARIFEAGTAETATGAQPFFAMEFVKGASITEHAALNRLSIADRLRLMIEVCAAVQHAHLKGVIHRDLKPGNVLVTDEGRVKVLDFGVARLSEGDASATMATQAGQMVGTLPYMSPEQLLADPDSVDTRSDVYSLGVILYEMLTGCLPHDFSSRSLADAVKTATEESPVSPRAHNPHLSGEVGLITMKALERERDRRYQSPAELAEDIQRFLDDEPIRATAPSRWYLARKFAKRNRALVVGTIAVGAALTAGLVGTAWQAVVTARERDRAVAAEARAERERAVARREERVSSATNTFLQTMLTSADPEQAQGREVTVREVVDIAASSIGTELQDQPVVEGRLRKTLGATYRSLGAYDKAMEQLDRSVALLSEHAGADRLETLHARRERSAVRTELAQLDEAETEAREVVATLEKVYGPEYSETVRARLDLARIAAERGDMKAGEALLREMLPTAERVLGREDATVLTARHNLGTCLKDQGRLEEAEQVLRGVLADRRRVQGDSHPETLFTINALATTLARRGNAAESESLLREVLASRRAVLGENHPGTILVKQNLVALITPQGRLDEAEVLAREVLEGSTEVFGAEHARTMMAVNSMAYILEDRGRLDEAEPLYRRALEIVRRTSGMAHPETFTPLNNLASILQRKGNLSESQRLFDELVRGAEAALTSDHYLTAVFKSNYGDCLREMKRFEEAEAQLLAAQATLSEKLGAGHARTVKNAGRLRKLYEEWGKSDKAAEWTPATGE